MPARVNQPSTYSDFNSCYETYLEKGYDGIGFVFTGEDPYVGIDLDDCLENDQLNDTANAILRTLSSYHEVSPSGKGIKIIIRADQMPTQGHKSQFPCGQKIEIYSKSHYFTITGKVLEKQFIAIMNCTKELQNILRQVAKSKQIEMMPNAFIRSRAYGWRKEDNQIVSKFDSGQLGIQAQNLWRGDWSGYPSQSEGDFALCNYLISKLGKDHSRIKAFFIRSKLYRRTGKHRDYLDRTIHKALSTFRTARRYNHNRTWKLNAKKRKKLNE